MIFAFGTNSRLFCRFNYSSGTCPKPPATRSDHFRAVPFHSILALIFILVLSWYHNYSYAHKYLKE